MPNLAKIRDYFAFILTKISIKIDIDNRFYKKLRLLKVFHVDKFSIPDLEKLLNFNYLPQITFEDLSTRQEVQMKGFSTTNAEAVELGNQYIQKVQISYIPRVSICWINNQVGYGLFAEEDIAAGSYVGEYTGIVRKNDRWYVPTVNNYCYEYPVIDEIGRNFVIDATEGCFTRFINHSFSPNLKAAYLFHDGFFHLIFLALSSIKRGDQLTFHYGRSYWSGREPPQLF